MGDENRWNDSPETANSETIFLRVSGPDLNHRHASTPVRPSHPGQGGPGYTIKDEPVLGSYRRGTLAMARTSAPDSQGSQFFIVLDNAAAGPLESARTYAILGEVVSGLDVVDAIAAVERDDTDRPINPVTIISAKSSPSAP